jgi:hypothetical protein
VIAALLIAASVAVLAGLLAARKSVALPLGEIGREVRVSRAFLKAHPGAPVEWHYFLTGPGGPDVGNHDEDKYVLHAVPGRFGVVFRVAPVDRQGRRTGRSRLVLTR